MERKNDFAMCWHELPLPLLISLPGSGSLLYAAETVHLAVSLGAFLAFVMFLKQRFLAAGIKFTSALFEMHVTFVFLNLTSFFKLWVTAVFISFFQPAISFIQRLVSSSAGFPCSTFHLWLSCPGLAIQGIPGAIGPTYLATLQGECTASSIEVDFRCSNSLRSVGSTRDLRGVPLSIAHTLVAIEPWLTELEHAQCELDSPGSTTCRNLNSLHSTLPISRYSLVSVSPGLLDPFGSWAAWWRKILLRPFLHKFTTRPRTVDPLALSRWLLLSDS